jgi:uncharacterized protein
VPARRAGRCGGRGAAGGAAAGRGGVGGRTLAGMDANVTPPAPGSTDRTRLRRLPGKAVTERATMHAILDAGRVAHVAIVHDGQPFALPVAYGRDGDRVLMHGSSGSRLFRALADGARCCFTVTLLDGLVLARSAFESSMNYRGVLALGTAYPLDGQEKLAALERISEHLMPGRWVEVRPPSAKELAKTLVVGLALDECSVKVSDGPPDDAPDDLRRPVWAGVLPISTGYAAPVPAPDMAYDLAPPSYLDTW